MQKPISKIFSFILVFFLPTPVLCAPLPDDFVYLRDIDPTILQDMRYATENNFMGQKIEGYKKGECILKREAAIALKNVQDALRKDNQTLIMFDCYRPQKAVTSFVNWVNSGDEFNARYFPKTHRSKLIEDGYIASRSGHSKGYTMDLAIAPIRKHWIKWFRPNVCGNRRDPNSLNFGTPFDCFDEAAHTNFEHISINAKKNRQKLLKIMDENGFRNLPDEWWHYTLRTQPQEASAYDFDVQ